jgi:hypothetical protein
MIGEAPSPVLTKQLTLETKDPASVKPGRRLLREGEGLSAR